MEICELKLDSINQTTKNKKLSQGSLNKEDILCSHCKRTASNGIRCLGICVADSEY